MKKSFFACLGLTISFFIMPTQKSASQSIIVSKNGSGNYKSINEAIQASSPHGDDILVMPGEYVEHILIEGRKELNIIAQGEVLIKRKASENVLTLTKCYRVTFQGFKLNGTVVFTDCENSTLAGCKVMESNGGIFVSNSVGTEIFGNTFTKNTSTPIVIEKSQQTKVINNVLHDNTGAEGIRTIKSDLSDDVIKNNTIAYNQFLPISIGEDCQAAINNNIICFNNIPGKGAAIDVKGETGKVKAQHNNIYDNKNAGGESITYRGVQHGNNLSVDPKFVNGPAKNFSLLTTSPCYGAGQDGTTRFGEPIAGINLGADIFAKGSPLNYEEQYDEGVAQRKKKLSSVCRHSKQAPENLSRKY